MCHINRADVRHYSAMWVGPITNPDDQRVHAPSTGCVITFAGQGEDEMPELVDAGWFKRHAYDHAKRREFFVERAPGVPVVLPKGATVADRYSITGKLMSPVSNLSPVAAAGRETYQVYRKLEQEEAKLDADAAAASGIGKLAIPFYEAAAEAYSGNAWSYLRERLFINVGTGGKYDYQRSGDQIFGEVVGFEQLPQFRDVSNFNVGLFCQKAGLTLEQTLKTAGDFAKKASSNAAPKQPYGLDPRTKEFIQTGHIKAQLYD